MPEVADFHHSDYRYFCPKCYGNPKMQEVSRQKKLEVLLGYIRSAELFEDHAGEGFL
jgi:hypothetical protein